MWQRKKEAIETIYRMIMVHDEVRKWKLKGHCSIKFTFWDMIMEFLKREM